MAEKGWAKRWGLTPIRVVLVAVLTLVLIIVLASQFSSGGATLSRNSRTDPVPQSPRKGSRPVKPARGSAAGSAPVVRQSERVAAARPWSRISVEEACRYNPLKMPSALVAPGVADVQAEAGQTVEANQTPDGRRQRLEERQQQRQTLVRSLQETGVGLVVTGDRGTYALIGTQVVHVGDVIEGFVVKEIGLHGVVLADQQAE